jgi:hypothetical protein
MTALLTAIGVVAFALSHVLGAAIGAWPAVLVTAALVFAVYLRVSDWRPSQLAGVRR